MLRTLLGLGLALVATAPAAGRAEALRVLLFESAEPVRVAGVRLEAVDGGIRGDGRALGPRWHVPGPGPHRAGPLRVRGALEVERSDGGLRVINAVELEDYVAGTLGREVYPDWADDALRAQAVVTRTYALYQQERRAGRPYALEAGTANQVYGGIDAETPSVRDAVRETRGEVLTWRGRPILAAFHSSSGGRTASAEEVWGRALPYLVSREVPYEDPSPDTYWRASVTRTTLGRALTSLGLDLGLGVVREARVLERSASGRALRVGLRGFGRGPKGVPGDLGNAEDSEDAGDSEQNGSGRGEGDVFVEVEGRTLRTALGPGVLRSTLFEVRNTKDGFVFVGSGHGHGVGMSQWGAQGMAERGASYREILAAFYPGTHLERRTSR